MKNFLAVFTGTPQAMEHSGWNALSDAERHERTQAGMKEWQDWMAKHESRISVSGGPVGKTMSVSCNGIGSAQNNICGYVVVSADSHEAAAKLFERHPHFSIFPGEAVEVMECLPVPGA